MINLKDCPFCGGRAQYSRIPGQGFSVLCPGCGAIAVYAASSTQEVLGQHWNARRVRHNLSAQGNIEPCPFCASRQVAVQPYRGGAMLQCGGCGMMVSFANGDDAAAATAYWNRREGA